MSNKKYVNVSALKSHFDGDEEMIADLLEIFETTYGEILNDTKSAVQSNSYSELEHSAHTLKGMIANFFSEELKNAAYELEQMGRKGEIVNAESHLEVLTMGIPALVEEVRKI